MRGVLGKYAWILQEIYKFLRHFWIILQKRLFCTSFSLFNILVITNFAVCYVLTLIFSRNPSIYAYLYLSFLISLNSSLALPPYLSSSLTLYIGYFINSDTF